jgi:hypothetical protein
MNTKIYTTFGRAIAATALLLASLAIALGLGTASASAKPSSHRLRIPAAARASMSAPVKARCSWSRGHHRGTKTCRYYRVNTLVKVCVKKPGQRARCRLVQAGGKGATPGGSKPTTEPPATGALLPTEEVEPAPTAASSSVPSSVDLSNYSVPVGNQGKVGSCVTWAIDYGMLGWYSRHDNHAGQPFNPMYTYSQIHLDNSAEGGGSYPSAALNIAEQQGNDTMAHYSVKSTTDFADRPNAADHANAANYKISEWKPLFQSTSGIGSAADAAAIKSALAQGKPVAIGMQVRSGFESLTQASPTDQDLTSQVLGRHEILAIGYDEGGLWIQNSWGESWGLKGYGHLSWPVVEHDVFEGYTISGFSAGQTGDTTAPVMGSVTAHLYGQQITGSATPVQFDWSATDNTGVTAYQVDVTADNGQTWAIDPYSPASATTIARLLPFGTTYRYAVAARDAAGNWSNWSYSRPVTATVTDDKSYSESGFWSRYSWGESFGGTYLSSNEEGAWITNTFTGTDVAWIAPKFANGSKAKVYCDGNYIGTTDLYSSSPVARQTVAWCHFAQSTTHTMKIVGEGTAGRPWTAVDAFVKLS